MCPRKSDVHSKNNIAVEGDQFNNEDKSVNVLNIHSHMRAITVSWVILAIVVVFVMYILYKKLEARMISRAEQRRTERANTASFSVEDLVAEIRDRRERAPGV